MERFEPTIRFGTVTLNLTIDLTECLYQERPVICVMRISVASIRTCRINGRR